MDSPGGFDFVSLLRFYLGTDSMEVQDLTGGSANHAVRVSICADPRAVKRIHDVHDDNDELKRNYRDVFNRHASLVLKQAPSYLAKAPHMQFSTYRQTIEATALRLFRQVPFIDVLEQNQCISIPRLLLHDNINNVIIQTDLGNLRNLYDVLISPEITISFALQLGQILGRFLAQMHDTHTHMDTGSFHNLIAEFQHADAERVLEDTIVQVAENMNAADIRDHNQLKIQALKNWRTRKKTAFSHGDLWFGSLLVKYPTSENHRLRIGLCDWEFAGPNHPAADIAQLGAYLQLLSISFSRSCPPRDSTVVDNFATNFYLSYFRTIHPPTDLLEYHRSLAFMHGWELINAACWDQRQSMWCSCPGNGIKCSHIKEMVEIGADFQRAAAGDQPESVIQDLKNIDWANRFFCMLKRFDEVQDQFFCN